MEFFINSAPILIITGLILVVIVLLVGLVSMLTKGDFNKKYSNTLMRLRVLIQGIIILIFALVFLIKFLN